MTTAGTNRPSTEDAKIENERTIREWAKRTLFLKLKFLYHSEEDLKVGNSIYKQFVRDCGHKLQGLDEGAPQEQKQLFLALLWNDANSMKKNLVSKSLALRRSGVYTVMQNRFNGKHWTQSCLIIALN